MASFYVELCLMRGQWKYFWRNTKNIFREKVTIKFDSNSKNESNPNHLWLKKKRKSDKKLTKQNKTKQTKRKQNKNKANKQNKNEKQNQRKKNKKTTTKKQKQKQNKNKEKILLWFRNIILCLDQKMQIAKEDHNIKFENWRSNAKEIETKRQNVRQKVIFLTQFRCSKMTLIQN